MAGDPSGTQYTVVIVGVKDAATKARVTRSLSRVTKNLAVEAIEARLEKLPWTLTRRATIKKASRLAELLEKLGAEIKVLPPLPAAILREVEPTQILPETKLLSGTQVMASTQVVDMPPGVAPSLTARPLLKPLSRPTPQPWQGDTGEEFGAPDIEPLTLAGILDRTFQICRRNFWKLFAVAAIPWLITAAIGLVAAIVIGIVGFTWKGLGAFAPRVLIVAGAALIPSMLVILVGVFYLGQGALIHAVSSIYLGRKIMVKEAYRFVYGRLGRFFLTSCLFTITAFGMVLLPMITGAFLFYAFRDVTGSGWWSVVTWPLLAIIPLYGITKLLLFDKVVIIENDAYAGALKRSWHLLSGKADSPWPRGYFLRLVILLHIFMLVYLTIDMIFRMPTAVLGLLLSQPGMLVNIVNQFMAQLSGLVAGIFIAVGMVVFYYDIRNRKEGFDLKMLSEMD